MRCLCVNHLCAKKTEYGILQDFCLRGCRTIRAEHAYGGMPDLLDSDERVIMLAKPPRGAVRIHLKEGALAIPFPTRFSTFGEDFVILFTMMTDPAPRILYTTILEAVIEDQQELQAALREFYGEKNVDVVELDKPSETRIYRTYTSKEGRAVVFEVKI